MRGRWTAAGASRSGAAPEAGGVTGGDPCLPLSYWLLSGRLHVSQPESWEVTFIQVTPVMKSPQVNIFSLINVLGPLPGAGAHALCSPLGLAGRQLLSVTRPCSTPGATGQVTPGDSLCVRVTHRVSTPPGLHFSTSVDICSSLQYYQLSSSEKPRCFELFLQNLQVTDGSRGAPGLEQTVPGAVGAGLSIEEEVPCLTFSSDTPRWAVCRFSAEGLQCAVCCPQPVPHRSLRTPVSPVPLTVRMHRAA